MNEMLLHVPGGLRGSGEAVIDCNETRYVRENNGIWADVNGNDYAYY